MSYAATWMDLEIIVLDEVRQRKTNMKYHLFLVLTLQPLFIYFNRRIITLQYCDGFCNASA